MIVDQSLKIPFLLVFNSLKFNPLLRDDRKMKKCDKIFWQISKGIGDKDDVEKHSVVLQGSKGAGTRPLRSQVSEEAKEYEELSVQHE